DDPFRLGCPQEIGDGAGIAWISDENLASRAFAHECLVCAREPRIHCGRRVRTGDESDARAALLHQVARYAITPAAIVDADQIVPAAFRIGQIAAVDQNDGDAGAFERLHDVAV